MTNISGVIFQLHKYGVTQFLVKRCVILVANFVALPVEKELGKSVKICQS